MMARQPNSLLSLVGTWLDRFLVGPGENIHVRWDENAWGYVPHLALLCGAALFLEAQIVSAGRHGAPWAAPAFYAVLTAMMAALFTRLVRRRTSRWERISVVVMAATALFVVRLIREPVGFVDHDSFLHWVSGQDILSYGRLFTPNPLLPVSPLYPGLEIPTTALVNLTGLGIFEASAILLLGGRLVFILALFLLYERLTKSSAAGIACFLYMMCSTFVVFDASFSYQSLALPLVPSVLLLLSQRPKDDVLPPQAILAVGACLLVALAITHHVTSLLTLALLFALAILGLLQRGDKRTGVHASILAVVGTGAVFCWQAYSGAHVDGYLGGIFERALGQMLDMIEGRNAGRVPFRGGDGSVTPLWLRLIGIASLLLTAVGLALGFFRALRVSDTKLSFARLAALAGGRIGGWNNSLLLLLVLLSILWPLTIILRLTEGGWEVGNRMGATVYLGVAIVLAIGLVKLSRGGVRSSPSAAVLGLAGGLCIAGGYFFGTGITGVPDGRYRVGADAASVEPMGVETARWSRAWLGPGNTVIADRVNRLLFATYGRQDVTTSIYDRVDAGAELLFAPRFDPWHLEILRRIRVDYIVSDLRLTTAPAVYAYVDAGGAADDSRSPTVESLRKFGRLPQVSRVLDNGYLFIFDVRALRAAKTPVLLPAPAGTTGLSGNGA